MTIVNRYFLQYTQADQSDTQILSDSTNVNQRDPTLPQDPILLNPKHRQQNDGCIIVTLDMRNTSSAV
jgi:hypothetical protein